MYANSRTDKLSSIGRLETFRIAARQSRDIMDELRTQIKFVYLRNCYLLASINFLESLAG